LHLETAFLQNALSVTVVGIFSDDDGVVVVMLLEGVLL
jgi:hypothetical protein